MEIYRCLECSLNFNTIDKYNNHLEDCKNITCSYCDKTFSITKEKEKHYEGTNDPECLEKRYKFCVQEWNNTITLHRESYASLAEHVRKLEKENEQLKFMNKSLREIIEVNK